MSNSNYINKYGRGFDSFEEYKAYVKTLNPTEVKWELEGQSKSFLTKEVQNMYNYCELALVHIHTRWADTFDIQS